MSRRCFELTLSVLQAVRVRARVSTAVWCLMVGVSFGVALGRLAGCFGWGC